MTKNRVDLVSIFSEVTQTLLQNQPSLDRADEINQDHGSNMVTTFQTITKAVKAQKKKGASDSTALAYAANQLAKKSTSSSGQQYARNLAAAASQFKGKQVDQRGAMDLLMTLIGGGAAAQTASQPAPQPSAQASGGSDLIGSLVGSMMGGGTPQASQPSAGGGDLLGSLLGGMLSGEQSQANQPQASGGGDLLGSLLGGMMGGSSSQPTTASQGDGQIGLDDLIQAGMAFFQAKQSGQGNLQALIQAFTAASRMGNTVHRQQSTELVVNSFLEAVAASGGK